MTIALGLGSRADFRWLPSFLREHAGDALWTVAAAWALAWAMPGARPWRVALLALALSAGVELSQLIQAQWLVELRGTLPGRLLLGSGWDTLDLARYAVGAALALAIDVSGVLAPAGGRGARDGDPVHSSPGD